MLKILALDPSGTGTTGFCSVVDKKITFHECQSKKWLEHLDFIKLLVRKYQSDLILYENTHFLKEKTQDSLSLFRLLGAIESLPVKTESLLVSQVKELKKQVFKGTKQIPNLTYKPGRG